MLFVGRNSASECFDYLTSQCCNFALNTRWSRAGLRPYPACVLVPRRSPACLISVSDNCVSVPWSHRQRMKGWSPGCGLLGVTRNALGRRIWVARVPDSPAAMPKSQTYSAVLRAEVMPLLKRSFVLAGHCAASKPIPEPGRCRSLSPWRRSRACRRRLVCRLGGHLPAPGRRSNQRS